MTEIRNVLRDALLIAVASAAAGLIYNALRADGLPWVALADHAVLVPCPAQRLGPAQPLRPDDPVLWEPGTLFVDAREQIEYQRWHWPGAVSVYYDLLAETPEYRETIRKLLVTHGQARRVVVYGDDEAGRTLGDGRPGDEAGTGYRLAGALASQGMRNVFYVLGGASALREVAIGPHGAGAPADSSVTPVGEMQP